MGQAVAVRLRHGPGRSGVGMVLVFSVAALSACAGSGTVHATSASKATTTSTTLPTPPTSVSAASQVPRHSLRVAHQTPTHRRWRPGPIAARVRVLATASVPGENATARRHSHHVGRESSSVPTTPIHSPRTVPAIQFTSTAGCGTRPCRPLRTSRPHLYGWPSNLTMSWKRSVRRRPLATTRISARPLIRPAHDAWSCAWVDHQ